MERFTRFFISNGKKGEESKIAERQREAENCGKREIASAIKWTVRKLTSYANVRLISEIKNVANDVAPMIRIRSSVCL
jgi:hypothetical protein